MAKVLNKNNCLSAGLLEITRGIDVKGNQKQGLAHLFLAQKNVNGQNSTKIDIVKSCYDFRKNYLSVAFRN